MKPSIEASAGTGKTTRVVELLLRRLLESDTEPARLLALTFTVRAANEMRDRLGAWLTRLLAGDEVAELGGGLGAFLGAGVDEDTARRRGAAALAALDRIEIGTIHSFAAHLLRQYPLEAGVSPAFEEDEGPAQAALFRERWPRWLEERLAGPADVEFVAALLDRVRMDDLARFAQALCEEGVPLVLPEDAARARAWRARLAEAAGRVQAVVGAHAGEDNAAMDALALMADLFTAPEGTARLRGRAALLEATAPRGWPERAEYADLRRLARAVLDVDDRLLGALLAWLRPFAEDFRAEFVRRGHLSFEGLIVRASDVLREHPDVRERLKRRFRLLVVDEFQDTDPEQAALLLYLAEREETCAADWRGVELEPGKLVIVGDPKQSIYSFRGADLEAYATIAERLTGGRASHVERLSVNYRARPELVHFVNAVGRRVMQEPAYVALVPGPGRPAGGRVELMLFEGHDADGARAAEAEAIAEWIAAGSAAGAFAWRDVALLLRALPDAHHYTEAFRRRGIDFAIEGEKHFYATQEVVDLLNLLRAIAEPTDELAVVGVLRSPLGAVRDRDLVHLRDAHALSPLDAERVPLALPDVRRLFDALAELHARARRLPVDDLLRDVLARFPLLAIARASFRGEQAVANVEKLVRALAGAGEVTLGAALADYRRRLEDLEEEGEAPLADEQLDAVRVLSIHKAKGLEFPVVVLPDLHRAEGRSDAGPYLRAWRSGLVGFRCGRLCNADRVAAEERRQRIADAEARRLLYVALTRARDRLLLTGGSVARSVVLGLVHEALRGEGLPIDDPAVARLEGDGFVVEVARQSGPAPPWAPAEVAASGPEPDYEAERSRWVEREAAARRLAATPALRRPTGAAEADLERAFRLERDDDAGGALSLGSRCHDRLARLDLARPDLGDADAEVRAILEPFVAGAAFADIRAADEVHREVPFVIELDGEVWSGQLDVLYRRGERWVVADYKSDREERPARHATQAEVYRRAVERLLGLAAPPEVRLLYLRSGRSVTL